MNIAMVMRNEGKEFNIQKARIWVENLNLAVCLGI
jgi:hypothetical protein